MLKNDVFIKWHLEIFQFSFVVISDSSVSSVSSSSQKIHALNQFLALHEKHDSFRFKIMESCSCPIPVISAISQEITQTFAKSRRKGKNVIHEIYVLLKWYITYYLKSRFTLDSRKSLITTHL